MKNRGAKIYLLLLAVTLLALAAEPLLFYARISTSVFDRGAELDFEEECPDGHHFTVIDAESREEVFHTARMVYAGDMFQTDDNRIYEVVATNEFFAEARFLRIEEIGDPSAGFYDFLDEYVAAGFTSIVAAQGEGSPRVAVYHSHSDESYLPSDGASSIRDNGGIFRVGESFRNDLQGKDIVVQQSKRSHDPHDKKSYQRSRRTAQELLRQNPAAILDVHRDALDRRFYMANIEGQDLAKVLLVVGRQNPNMQSNKRFAQELKAVADRKYPGLVKGIFFGRGSYNQDLSPRALLLEMGTHKNSREEAKRGASLFAEVLADYLGAAGAGAAGGFAREGAASRSSLFVLLGLLVVGGLGYLYVSTGSVEEMQKKIKQFVTTEFSGSLGRAKERTKLKSRDDDDDPLS
jgi:stage II sporulation protein P